MRKAILILLTLVAINLGAQAQTFQDQYKAMKYQAVARDINGDILPNQTIVVGISITHGLAIAYTETHNPITNEHGMFTLDIGQGTPTNGGTWNTYEEIGWNDLVYGMLVFVDFDGGGDDLTEFASLKSVPFANMAREATILLDSAWVPVPDQVDPIVHTGTGYRVGIGTTSPDTTLHVVGKIKYQDGTEGSGKVLTSDAEGNATWAGPSEWQDLTLLNGWTVFGGVQPTFYRGADGTVRFRGRITDPSSTEIFQLPLEFRPSQTLYISIHDSTSGGKSFLIVNLNGSVTLYSTFAFTSSTVFYLDGISFVAN